MFEHHESPLLPRKVFYTRLAKSSALGLAVVIVALSIGMIGYHSFENMPWVDSFENASMILSGMGPVGELKTQGGKIFAGCYALFSGLAFISILAIIFAPIVHRFLHKFHLEGKQKSD